MNKQLHEKINSKMHEIHDSLVKPYEKEIELLNNAIGSGWYVGKNLERLRTRKYKLIMKERALTNYILVLNGKKPAYK